MSVLSVLGVVDQFQLQTGETVFPVFITICIWNGWCV